MPGLYILPIPDGEGDHPQGGGGVSHDSMLDPSTMLRMVPLPNELGRTRIWR
jgi:hypothetical protein